MLAARLQGEPPFPSCRAIAPAKPQEPDPIDNGVEILQEGADLRLLRYARGELLPAEGFMPNKTNWGFPKGRVAQTLRKILYPDLTDNEAEAIVVCLSAVPDRAPPAAAEP